MRPCLALRVDHAHDGRGRRGPLSVPLRPGCGDPRPRDLCHWVSQLGHLQATCTVSPRSRSPRSVEARWASVSFNCGRQVWLAWGHRRACGSSGGQYRTRSGAVLLGSARRGDQLPVAVDQLRSRGRRRFGHSATARDHGPLGRCSGCARDPEPGPSVIGCAPPGLRSRSVTIGISTGPRGGSAGRPKSPKTAVTAPSASWCQRGSARARSIAAFKESPAIRPASTRRI